MRSFTLLSYAQIRINAKFYLHEFCRICFLSLVITAYSLRRLITLCSFNFVIPGNIKLVLKVKLRIFWKLQTCNAGLPSDVLHLIDYLLRCACASTSNTESIAQLKSTIKFQNSQFARRNNCAVISAQFCYSAKRS